MPTSSQALILIKTDSSRLCNFYKRRITPDAVPFPISTVNLTDELSAHSSHYGKKLSKGFQSEGRLDHSATRPLEGLTVNGYRGVLSFDSNSRSFRWQLLPDPVKSKPQLGPTRKKRHMPTPESRADDTSDDRIHEEVVLTNIDDQPSNSSIEGNYRRLLDLGFRTSSFRGIEDYVTSDAEDGKPSIEPKRTSSSRPSSSYRRTSEVQVIRSRQVSEPSLSPSRRHRRNEKNSRSGQQESEPPLSEAQTKQLLEEVKRRNRKKRPKFPIIRMRKDLPPPDPQALCFCLKNKNVSHEEVKGEIEKQIGEQIESLQYDPVYVQLGAENTDNKCFWVFTLADEQIRGSLLVQGLKWEGERIRVRRYDSVMREEHEAYKLFKEIEDEKRAKGLKCSYEEKAYQKSTSSKDIDRHVGFKSRG